MANFLHLLSTTLVAASVVGQPVEDFQLKDYRGVTHRLQQYSETPIVVIAVLGTECPLAKLYGPRLEKFWNTYREQGVQVIGLNPNAQDSARDIREYAHRHGVTFPILKDPGARIADRLGATRTPEVFVLDAQRRIRYHGRIDDQYGVGFIRDKPIHSDLRAAVDRLLAGEPITVATTKPVGCLIGRPKTPRKDATVSYCNQIVRIFQKQCIDCHRSGDIGPFELTDYNEIVGWADTIAEVVRDGRMPPWHANPAYGKFRNERRLTDREKQLIYDWVDAGAPYGDKADLPPPKETIRGWRLPKRPDAVFEMSRRPFRVPVEGVIDYQYFVVDPKFTEDKWIAAAEVVPGDRSVVHHAIVSVRVPKSWNDSSMSWLAAYVPGQDITRLEPDQAYFIPAGSQFIFQLHYTPTGAITEDVTKLGIVFADRSKLREKVFTMVAMNRRFKIPPGAANYRVATTLDGFPKGARLLSLSPHMHLRGKSFQFILNQGKKRTILLDVPHFDSNWQHTYQFQDPIPLSPQSRITCVAHFDNSEENPVNPDPKKTVEWGEQVWDEMMLAYVGIAVPIDDQLSTDAQNESSAESKQATKLVDTFFRRFDKNRDGVVEKNELPESLQQSSFRRFDADRDGKISRQETMDQALRTVRERSGR